MAFLSRVDAASDFLLSARSQISVSLGSVVAVPDDQNKSSYSSALHTGNEFLLCRSSILVVMSRTNFFRQHDPTDPPHASTSIIQLKSTTRVESTVVQNVN